MSTTFASFDRIFSHLRAEALGWLFIDEAGRANPQHAVGAIWRSRRVVVVGDPFQLEPVRPVSLRAQQAIRRHAGVEERWLPTLRTVQQIADVLTPFGTSIVSRDKANWVGAPLRVHRRCDSPMFDICNEVAYDGMMISATDGRSRYRLNEDQPALPDSKWIHVPSDNNDGHWIPPETNCSPCWLYRYGMTIANMMVIAPFKDVVEELRALLNERYTEKKILDVPCASVPCTPRKARKPT